MGVIPKKIPIDYEIIPLAGARKLLGADKGTSALYIGDGYTLRKTLDFGETYEAVHTFPSRVDRLEVLDDGALLVACLSGKVYRYADGSAEEVLSMSATPLHGFNAVGNIVVVGEYNYPPTKVWLSTDYGKTWKAILELSGASLDHCHDAVYDPYEHIIWTCWGDGRPFDTVLFSDDLGTSWQSIEDKYYMRATNIMPLPDCVLFGTDQYYTLGTYRHDRPREGTSQTVVRPYLDWRGRKDTFADASIWAMKPAIVYGPPGEAMAFWGYRMPNTGVIPPVQIYASDGVMTRPIWSLDRLGGGVEENGILGVFGPTASGHLFADLRTTLPNSDGVDCTRHILKVAWDVLEA
jgi:hypothetical protein